MSVFKLQCFNKSRLDGMFSVFQAPPAIQGAAPALSLAWLSRPSAPGTKVTFSWSTQWHFIWGEHGGAGHGARFDSSQILDADPERENTVDLSKNSFGSPVFTNLRAEGPAGTLTINQLNQVFDYPVAVGIGMASAASAVVMAHPNVTTVFVPTKTKYYVVFGGYSTGDVLVKSVSPTLILTFESSAPMQRVVFDNDNILRTTSDH